MRKCSIYKIKEESNELFNFYRCDYFYVSDFAKNPLIVDAQLQCVFVGVNIETMEFEQFFTYVLPCDEFEKHFEFHMGTHEINKKLLELGIE
jgi:hypothetical protein